MPAWCSRSQVRRNRSAQAARLAAQDLWETCHCSTAAANDNATLNPMRAGVVRPALPAHDVMRLRGCLQDANTNRTSAVVLGEEHAEHQD